MTDTKHTAAQPLDLDRLSNVGKCIHDYAQVSKDDLDALIAEARAARLDTTASASWINDVVRDVAELPDRDSPSDQPDMMLVTANELHEIIERRAAQPVQTGVAVDRPTAIAGVTESMAATFHRWEQTANTYRRRAEKAEAELAELRATLAPVAAQQAALHGTVSGKYLFRVGEDGEYELRDATGRQVGTILFREDAEYIHAAIAQQAAAKAPVCEACNGDGYYEHKGSDTGCRVCGGSGAAKAPAAQAVELAQVQEQIKQGSGFWHSCSGCYDTEDGHPTAPYAYSNVFGCALGNGCSECGGIGAVWDNTDYEAMAADMEAASPASTPEASQQAGNVIGDPLCANKHCLLHAELGSEYCCNCEPDNATAGAATTSQDAPSEKQAKLRALADRIDFEELWRGPAMDRHLLSNEQRDRLDAGVMLRRYGEFFGPGRWLLIPPTGCMQFGAGSLDKVYEMAKREEERKALRATQQEGGK